MFRSSALNAVSLTTYAVSHVIYGAGHVYDRI